MNEIVQYEQTDSWVPMLGAVGDLANKVAGTEFVGKAFRGKPASVAAAILTGRELALGPMTSLRGLDVIDGRVSMSAQLVAAKLQAAGHRIDWIENTDKAAEVRIVRGDGLGEASARWTLTDAQRAGLAGKTNWARYPRAMLRARALTECAGMVASDVLMGIEATEPGDQQQPVVTASRAIIEPPQAAALPAGQPEPETEPQPEAEPAADPGPVPADPGPVPVTPAQLRKLNAQLTQLERADGRKLSREERRDMIAALAGVEQLATAKDLTADEASRAIEALARTLDAVVVEAEVVEE